MSEKLTPKGPESISDAESKEVRKQLEKMAEKLRNEAEKESKSHERKRDAIEARKSAENEAISGKEKAPSASEKKRQREPVHKHVKKQTYKATMRRVESKLPAYQRTFSRVINNDTVDKVSNVAGRTVARPSAILGGGVIAFLGLGIVTLVANSQGFPVNSGAVFISLLLIGWAVGLIVEGIYRAVRRD